MSKVVVTGAAGFLGSHLCKELVRQKHEVIGLDNMCTGQLANIQPLLEDDRFTFVHADVSSPDVLFNTELREVEQIYHLASPASPRFYQAMALETIAVNTNGTKTMLELAKAWNAKMVYTSTSEIYGDPLVHPQSEDYRGNVATLGPRACYDEAKRMGEVYCYEYYRLYRVPVKIARLFNTYSAGLRNDDGRVISNFVTQALCGKELTVYGDGSQTRSFCYVDDTIRGLQLLMQCDEANGEAVNLGNPEECSINTLANLIIKLTGSVSGITYHPLPADDPKVRRPVIEKARALLGWQPEVTLEQGLTLTIENYRRQMH
ncbi:NAD-dependent epimerase/dehydratase family protein [Paenibacillus senegalensis]|uniref:NAD-dependent epimerase/dehydratase family protein n=1 Tax=Paenibacillus senegalensis TaxID=1465766 RepID=UPI00028901BF|nr:NAD-dependent epimerase/dehydratase family protein [Paenibacillus senegalensis]